MATSTSQASSPTQQATVAGNTTSVPKSNGGSAKLSKEDLQELYRDKTRSVAEVRTLLGVSGTQFYELLKQHGIPHRRKIPSFKLRQREELARAVVADWQSGVARSEIAKRYGVSKSWVYQQTRPDLVKRFSFWRRLIDLFK